MKNSTAERANACVAGRRMRRMGISAGATAPCRRVSGGHSVAGNGHGLAAPRAGVVTDANARTRHSSTTTAAPATSYRYPFAHSSNATICLVHAWRPTLFSRGSNIIIVDDGGRLHVGRHDLAAVAYVHLQGAVRRLRLETLGGKHFIAVIGHARLR